MLKSIRCGQMHYQLDRAQPEDFKSRNKAKRYSRQLGGAGYVKVVQTHAEAKALHAEHQS